MEILNILVATVVAFAAGAVWYMKLAEPWMEAAAIPRDAEGKPEGGQSPKLFAIGFLCQLIVAAMMHYVFRLAGITGVVQGTLLGIGVGLFFITPWIALNNSYVMRPNRLTLIDGGYAALACGLMGLVLTLF